jgi:hypothetical protein
VLSTEAAAEAARAHPVIAVHLVAVVADSVAVAGDAEAAAEDVDLDFSHKQFHQHEDFKTIFEP